MTEVPEHLLRRSRERRAALGLAGGEVAPAAAPAPEAPALEAPAPRPVPAEVEPAAPAAPAVVEEEAPVRPVPVAPSGPHKTKVPVWVMPVLIALPLWAILYPGAFGNHQKATAPSDPYAIGSQVFASAGCSTCHGNQGEGGVGPKLHGGEAKLTFPSIRDQINWVRTGSGPFAGKKYGDPNRPGGQHGPASGGMPAFAGQLTDQQVQDVVMYERDRL